MANEILTGVVESQNGVYWIVRVENAPRPHLATHNLVRSQMGLAQVGDTVTLAYFSSPARAFWHVTGIVAKGRAS